MSKPEQKADGEAIREMALAVIDTEAGAVRALAERIDDTFVTACSRILDCRGRVVVIGMGKSGHIGSKIAATRSIAMPTYESRNGSLRRA